MTDFRKVAKTGEIPTGKMRRVDIGDHEIVIAHVGDSYYAFDNVCRCIPHFAGHPNPKLDAIDAHTHGGRLARLAEGQLSGETVICPEHTTAYSVRTGRPLSGPGDISIGVYEVRIDGDDLKVAMMSDSLRHFWHDPGHDQRP